jgi:hypothetical protein
MGRAHVRDPVAHGLVDGLLERPLARLDAPDLGAHEAHPEDVERLPLHVDRAHVDDALKAELGADRGRGHAVLAGAGLRYDPLLAHAHGEEGLADRVVDLVGAGVEQVLPLEIDPRAPEVVREALGAVERRRAPREIGEVAPELGLELGIHARLGIHGLELLKGRHERLRNEDAPVRAEVPGCIREGGAVDS